MLRVNLLFGEPRSGKDIDFDLECLVDMGCGVGVVMERSSLIYCKNLVNGMTRSVSILNLLWVMLGGRTRCVCLDL